MNSPSQLYALFSLLRKWSLLGLLLILCVLFFYFDLHHYLNLETIRKYQSFAQTWTALHYQYAVLLFICIYTLMIACAIPGGTILTLLGGFLFGMMAFFYVLLGTVLGGVILFYAVRMAISSHIAQLSSKWIKTVERGFQRNAFMYLVTLRLIPIFPCWVSNITAGALNVPLSVFITATIIGVTPATLIYVMVGRGLDKIISSSATIGFGILLTPSILFPLLALAFLSLFPVIYKGIKREVRK